MDNVSSRELIRVKTMEAKARNRNGKFVDNSENSQKTFSQNTKFFNISSFEIKSGRCRSGRNDLFCTRSRLSRDHSRTSIQKGLSIAILIAIVSIECSFGTTLFKIPKVDAEQLCGAKLVDALRFLCGERGIYNPVVKVGRTSSSGPSIPEDITVLCCKKSCTMQQLKQYCGKPAETPEQRRRQHLLHLQAILPYGRNRSRRPHGRFQPRHRPSTAALRDERRTTAERRTPLTRSSRHVIRDDEWERYSKMTLHHFLKAYAEDHSSDLATTNDNEEVESNDSAGLLRRITDLREESSGS